jgi:hypothetical protein
MRRFGILVLFLAVVLGSFMAARQPLAQFVQITRLQASDAAPGDNFGYHLSLSADGNTLAVGSLYKNTSAGEAAGAVYIFVRSGRAWIEQARLAAGDAAANDHFGHVVALSADGSVLAVGAPYASDVAGKVYVFRRTVAIWTEEAKLQADDATPGFEFGVVSISRDGKTIAAGSWTASNSGGEKAGNAYVFSYSNGAWTQQARLNATDASPGALFGVSTALSFDGDTLAVSAYNANNSGGAGAGNAYVFVRSGKIWTEQGRLQASDAAPNATFGSRIALSDDGNTLATGAYHASNSGGALAGNAYVFTRSGNVWTEQGRLQASDAAAGDGFGGSIALSSDGNILCIGAYAKDVSGNSDAGGAYVFKRSGGVWTEQVKLHASDADEKDYFGTRTDISASGETLAVSAYGDNNSGGVDAGSVYMFTRAPPENAQ